MKTLFIGLGGTGLNAVKNLVEKYNEFGDKIDERFFITIDMDTQEFSDLNDNLGNVGIENIKLKDVSKTEAENFLKKNPNVKEWLPTPYPIAGGCNQRRGAGKELLAIKYKKIERKIASIMGEMSETNPRIIVVASSAGGTGAGMFIDIGYILKNLLKNYAGGEILGVLLLDDVMRLTVPDIKSVNTAVMLQELNYLMIDNDNNEIPVRKEYDFIVNKNTRITGEQKNIPYDLVYTVSTVGHNRVINDANKKAILKNVTDSLFYLSVAVDNLIFDSHGKIEGITRKPGLSANYLQNELAGLNDESLFRNNEWIQSRSKRFGSFGTMKIEFPSQEIAKYLLAKEGIVTLQELFKTEELKNILNAGQYKYILNLSKDLKGYLSFNKLFNDIAPIDKLNFAKDDIESATDLKNIIFNSAKCESIKENFRKKLEDFKQKINKFIKADNSDGYAGLVKEVNAENKKTAIARLNYLLTDLKLQVDTFCINALNIKEIKKARKDIENNIMELYENEFDKNIFEKVIETITEKFSSDEDDVFDIYNIAENYWRSLYCKEINKYANQIKEIIYDRYLSLETLREVTLKIINEDNVSNLKTQIINNCPHYYDRPDILLVCDEDKYIGKIKEAINWENSKDEMLEEFQESFVEQLLNYFIETEDGLWQALDKHKGIDKNWLDRPNPYSYLGEKGRKWIEIEAKVKNVYKNFDGGIIKQKLNEKISIIKAAMIEIEVNLHNKVKPRAIAQQLNAKIKDWKSKIISWGGINYEKFYVDSSKNSGKIAAIANIKAISNDINDLNKQQKGKVKQEIKIDDLHIVESVGLNSDTIIFVRTDMGAPLAYLSNNNYDNEVKDFLIKKNNAKQWCSASTDWRYRRRGKFTLLPLVPSTQTEEQNDLIYFHLLSYASPKNNKNVKLLIPCKTKNNAEPRQYSFQEVDENGNSNGKTRFLGGGRAGAFHRYQKFTTKHFLENVVKLWWNSHRVNEREKLLSEILVNLNKKVDTHRGFDQLSKQFKGELDAFNKFKENGENTNWEL